MIARLIFGLKMAFIILVIPGAVYAHVVNTSFLFLRIVNTPTEAAMGGCSVNNINESSAIYNPGALGLLHLSKNFAVSMPNNTVWLPELDSSLRLKSFSISGRAFTICKKSNTTVFRLSAGLSYSRIKLAYNDMAIVDPAGNYLGSYDAYDKTDLYTISLGIQYYLRIGAGYTVKKIKSELSTTVVADPDAHDYGFLAELPIGDIIPIGWGNDSGHDPKFNLDITPSFAYVKANLGDDFYYSGVVNADRLPKIKRTGFAVSFSCNMKKASLVSARIARETERNLYGGEIEFKRNGYEVGFLGAFYYRWGKIDDGDMDYKTKGIGINLRGIIAIFNAIGPGYSGKTAKYLADNLDFKFGYAWYGDDADALAGTNFVMISLSL